MQVSGNFRLNRKNRESLRRIEAFIAVCRQLGPLTHVDHVWALLLLAQNRNLTISDLARLMGCSLASSSRHVQRLRRPPGVARGDPSRLKSKRP